MKPIEGSTRNSFRNNGERGNPSPKIGCVIMASGLSVRFGKNKLFAEWDGKTFLERILDTTEGIFSRRVVVTRSEDAAAVCRKKGVKVIFHSFPNRNDTVRLGTAYMEGMDGVLFCPCDQPLLHRESLLGLLEAFQEGDILRLAYGEKTGMPVLFDKAYFTELQSLPEKKGGSYLIGKYGKRVKAVQATEEYELLDVDTPEELENLQAYCAKKQEEKGGELP
ncbi:MAG: nucleotidyltransferase family protein [Bacteroidales bacterium]|nr:nucleotidyltransferase family protein [Anaerotignum sp.]MCI5679063.1 nucleotidyltransferase family protein [Bacteroidales bacterium]MDY3927232.1 nucleotidyltransferase family protein [Anaerotignum sp.]